MSGTVKLSEHSNLFKNVSCIDVFLTNKCNLRCTYCFEQHTDDNNAHFTGDMLKGVWRWFRDLNDEPGKKLQLFGGEPMLHRKTIMDFLHLNRDEMFQPGAMMVSLVTNGLLVDEPFVKEFYQFPNTELIFSLDTTDPTVDERGLSVQQIELILDNIRLACKYGTPKMVTARCNITRENRHTFKELFARLYEAGIRRFYFHPIVHSFDYGFIVWEDDELQAWQNDIYDIVDLGYDLDVFSVVEGVGSKKDDQATITDLAIDGSGDFTNCYVWINRKQELLGNIYSDTLFLDKFHSIKNEFDEMIDNEEKCRSCNIKNLCFQFAAGNKHISGKAYLPTEMCQKLLHLYVNTNDRLAQMKFRKKMQTLMEAHAREGDVVLARSLVFLIRFFLDRENLTDNANTRKFVFSVFPSSVDVKEKVAASCVTTKQLLGLLKSVVEGRRLDHSVDAIIRAAVLENLSGSAQEVYHLLRGHLGVPAASIAIDGPNSELIYVGMLHMVIMSRLTNYHAVGWGGYE
jgi:uncharacterized protein